MNFHFTFKIIIFFYFSLDYLRAEILVKIDQGLLNGTRFETRNRKVSAFLGIPYGQPPIGELRFKSPLPAQKWDGVRSAYEDGNYCAQMSLDQKHIYGEEDCLYLNVFTPLLEFNSSIDEKKLMAVMVWIHGGGFYFGTSSPQYFGPKYLLDKDIVFVSMNYRLGIFGFLTTGDAASPGNYGLKDQVLALKWVQKNIRNFGGNPKKVTIFGESAGGASVNLHAISDSTRGLFHQYIVQSGSALCPWAYRNRTKFVSYLDEVVETVNCSINNTENFINCLRNKSVETLLKANPSMFLYFPSNVWIPTDEVESEDAFLTDSPKNLISQNKMKDLPSISGTVVDEGLLITSAFYANEMSMEILEFIVGECMRVILKHYSGHDDNEKLTKIVQDYYFKKLSSLSNDTLLTNLTIFLGDSQFFYPQVSVMDKMARTMKNPSYFYSFGYLSPDVRHIVDILNLKKKIGVAHAEELSYLFHTNTSRKFLKKDEKILNLMVDLWTSFAINGKPSSVELENPYLWQPYAKNNTFLQIGNILNNTDPSVTMENNYFSSRMDFWRKQFPISLNFFLFLNIC